MTALDMGIAIVRVAALALVFGAGIPALFALAMRAHSGSAVRNEQGEVIDTTAASPQMRALAYSIYAALGVVIFIAILWVAREMIGLYTGWYPFGDL